MQQKEVDAVLWAVTTDMCFLATAQRWQNEKQLKALAYLSPASRRHIGNKPSIVGVDPNFLADCIFFITCQKYKDFNCQFVAVFHSFIGGGGAHILMPICQT